MGLNCGCNGALPTLPTVLCKAGFGQIQRIVFQRRFDDNGEVNKITPEQMSQAATWISLSVAEDSTKIVLSPFIGNPELGSGAKRAFGGDNSTVNGIELNMGREAAQFSAVLYEESQDLISCLKEYMCETLGVYLVDEYGNIAATTYGDDFAAIPIANLFIGDKGFGGLTEPDANAINFSLKPNWSDKLVMLRAEDLGYNLLYDLDREFSRDFNGDFNSDFAIF